MKSLIKPGKAKLVVICALCCGGYIVAVLAVPCERPTQLAERCEEHHIPDCEEDSVKVGDVEVDSNCGRADTYNKQTTYNWVCEPTADPADTCTQETKTDCWAHQAYVCQEKVKFNITLGFPVTIRGYTFSVGVSIPLTECKMIKTGEETYGGIFMYAHAD